MSTGGHDTLVRRLALILVKLNQGEKLDPKQLADEFNVNLRTIQRDINQRFGYLPLEKAEGKYSLNPAFLGRLTLRDVEQFAGLAGVRGLFPSLSEEFFREIFDVRVETAWVVKGHSYENLAGRENDFRQLEQAISARERITFHYPSGGVHKAYEVEPYKLINNRGVWYLAARHKGTVKTFSFSKLERLQLTDVVYVFDPAVVEALTKEDGVWFSGRSIDVLLEVDKEAAHYFKRRKLIANQVIEDELADGSLMLSTIVGHANQILPIVRYWIPNVRICSPDWLRQELVQGLYDYSESARS